jgi:hypothetical protein
MAIFDFFLSRNNGTDLETYVGHKDRLFYDTDEKLLRISDGVTPGGKVINSIALVSTSTPSNPSVGDLWYKPTTKELLTYYNGSFRGTINAATETTIGGIKAGPGVVVASDGTLSLDSTGIPFNFGDFYAFTNEGDQDGACLSSINLDQDVNIVSNGEGSINVIGEFHIHTTNNNVNEALTNDPVFSVDSEGDTSLRTLNVVNKTDLGLMAPLNVTINADGLTKTPTVISGSVAQFTGRDNRTALLVLDTYGLDSTSSLTGGEFTFRAGRGTNASTSAVQSGDRLGRITAAGWASNGYGGIGVGGISILANENYTPTARGSRVEIYVTQNGTITPATVATIDSTGITMASGKVLTGNVTGNASTASKVSNALTAGFGVKMSSGTTYDGSAALTLNQYHAVTGPVTVVANAYALDLTTASGIVILDNSQNNFTVTISNPVAGKVVRLIVLNMKGGPGAPTVTVSGLTATNSSTGAANFQYNGGGTGIAEVEFICTTSALSGVYMVASGAK